MHIFPTFDPNLRVELCGFKWHFFIYFQLEKLLEGWLDFDQILSIGIKEREREVKIYFLIVFFFFLPLSDGED